MGPAKAGLLTRGVDVYPKRRGDPSAGLRATVVFLFYIEHNVSGLRFKTVVGDLGLNKSVGNMQKTKKKKEDGLRRRDSPRFRAVGSSRLLTQHS